MSLHPKAKWYRRLSLNPTKARARARARVKGRRSDEGVSLMEVVVAFTVLMIVVTPLSYLLTETVSQASMVRQHQAALELAEEWTQILSNSSPPNLVNGLPQTDIWAPPTDPAGVLDADQTIGGTPFTTEAEYELQDATGGENLCGSDVNPPSVNNPAVLVLSVRVQWDGHNQDGQTVYNQSVFDRTNLQYPTPEVQTDGYISVQVNTSAASDVHGVSAATRVQAVPVWITPSGGTAVKFTPNSQGCVFDQVPQGDYTISLDQPPSGAFASYAGSPAFVDDPFAQNPDSFSGSPPEADANVQYAGQLISRTANFDEGVTPTLTFASATPVQDGVQCPGPDGTGYTCVTTGTDATGSAASASSGAWTSTGSNWSTGTVTGASRIVDVACTTGAAPTCVGVGNGSGSAVIVSNTGALTGGSAQVDTLPAVPGGIATLTQVVCPSASGCYALGVNSAGTPILLAGSFAGTPTWQQVADPAETPTALTSIACPSPTICELAGNFESDSQPSTQTSTTASPGILRLDGDPSSLTPAFTLDALPIPAAGATGITAVTTLSCPAGSPSLTCVGLATGDAASGTDPVLLTSDVAPAVGPAPLPTSSTWIAETGFGGPDWATSLSGLACTIDGCMATGTDGGVATAFAGDLTQSPHVWQVVAGVSTSVTSLTGVSCDAPSTGDLTDCLLAGTDGGTTTGTLLTVGLSNSSGSDVWSSAGQATLPSTVQGKAAYFTGLACSSSGGTCSATGASPEGAFVLSAPGASGTWKDTTPSSLNGARASSIPVEISVSPDDWMDEPLNGGALANTLYPRQTDYSVAAGDCKEEANYGSQLSGTTLPVTGQNGTLSAVPGSSPSGVVPLGMLPVDVTTVDQATSLVAPVGGATVTLTANTPSGATDTCTADTYTLPLTGPDGMSRTAVPFGLYSLTVTSATTSITEDILVGTAENAVRTEVSPNTYTATPYPLPGAVPVVLP